MKCSPSGAFLPLFILSSISSGLTSVVSKDYKHVKFGSTWAGAQNYCRQHHDDLATTYTQSDMNSMELDEYFIWVGLYRNTGSDGGNWSWSDGANSHSYEWAENEPGQSDNCAAVFYPNMKFYGKDCETYLSFTCWNNDISNAQYYSILVAKTWSQAQEICRTFFKDLASFYSSSLNNIITEENLFVWIGLYRDGGSWNWSSGISDYVNWASNEPSNNGDCVSVSSMTRRMSTQNCGAHLSFVCITDNVFLVKENKSWEEALEHCRGHSSPTNSSLHFDLLSVEPGDEHDYVMNKVMQANTEEVWTGLRFLSDEWLWVNGADMLYPDLPVCPALGQHCGALSKNNTGSVKAKDCLERKNFLCYSY